MRGWHLNKHEEEVREGAMWVSGGRAFQAERTAHAEVLSQVRAATSRNRRRAMWLDRSE